MRALVVSLSICVFTTGAGAQPATTPPRFEDYPVNETFEREPTAPKLITPEERRFWTVIRQGITKGYGVAEQPSGKERPGPNFAGHYFIVTWGCGSPCLMAAIVDGKSGRVLPPPFHHGPSQSHFQVPWAFPMQPALDYRLDSRLLIANICESDKATHINGHLAYKAERCGTHYFLIGNDGLKLIFRALKK